MNKVISNNENIHNLKKRKILRIIIIILAIVTIILSLASIFFNINIIIPLLFFVITHFLLKYRNKIIINKK